jgi:hypothetical protein
MPPHPRRLDAAYMFSGAVDVATRQDTVAVIASLSDTVYIYTSGGELVRKLPLRSEHFRRIERAPPEDLMNPVVRREWSESFSRMSQVFWAPDGTLYVQYFDMEGVEAQWRLVVLAPDGTKRFEIHESSRLLAVSPHDSKLVFLNPTSLETNKWLIGTFSN